MSGADTFHVLGAADVRRLLPMETCIGLVRDAMMRLSRGDTRQLLRQVLPLGGGRAIGAMLGAMGSEDVLGAKIIAVDPEARRHGRSSHRGGILLFDPVDNRPLAIVHAGEVTAIRTAAASAVATDSLARPEASRLAILGYGEQARAHVDAMRDVRAIDHIAIWGRDPARARDFAAEVATGACPAIAVADPARCVTDAEIICTVSGASEPLFGAADVAAGTHINLVGSSVVGPREISDDLVATARFFGDYRPGVLAQGAEFVHARDQGIIDNDHFLAEIGELLSGTAIGRETPTDITIYKSLGHIVQDLVAAQAVYRAALGGGATASPF